MVFVLLAAAIVSGKLVESYPNALGAWWINVGLAFVFMYPSTYLHEFGHAIVAGLVGIYVSRIEIGTGRPLLQTKIFGIPLLITSRLNGGLTSLVFGIESQSRIKHALVAAGGAAANLFAIAACIQRTNVHALDLLGVNGPSLSGAFIIANLVQLVFNLVPMNIIVHERIVPNDGLTLVRAPFLTEADFVQLAHASQLHEALRIEQERRWNEAVETYEST